MAPKSKARSEDSSRPGGSQKKRKDSQSSKGKKGKNDLAEQIAAAGGERSDIDLVKGSREGQLVQGVVDEDPSLKDDVNKFLAGLKSGKDTSSKSKKPKKTTKEPESTPAPVAPKANPQKKAKGKAKVEKTTEAPSEPEKPALGLTGVSLTKGHGKLVFEPNAHWYSATPPLPSPPKPLPTPSTAQVSTLSNRAALLFESDTATYQASSTFTGKSASDTHFLNTILSKGTLSDRLSALTLLVQASPVHNRKALDSLKSMAERGRGKGGREEGLKAMRCVVDWWVGGGAPPRKLRYFRDQPLLHPSVTDQHLVAWYFEDWLKKYFFAILQILETYSLDPLPYVRTQALAFITTLLREKPEQEQNLLRLLVNKLGDTEKSVCSRASYHLLQVLQAHPAMKGIIVREIKTLVFKPTASTSGAALSSDAKQNNHIRFGDDAEKQGSAKSKGKGKDKASADANKMDRWNSHAWYYASVTLNQVVLTASDHDRDVARTLIDLYFEMFREILGGSVDAKDITEDASGEHTEEKSHKKRGKAKELRGEAGFAEVEDANSRLVSAVLAGVNRALPFAKVDMAGGNELFKKHIDTLFLITHTSTFNISLQALMLILQIVSSVPAAAPSTSKDGGAGSFFTTIADRFYRTLYASLADQRLGTSNKQAMYLNLIFKALKADRNVERVKAFVRRFIQVLVVGIGGTGGVEFVAGGLYLLGELFSTVPGLRAMFSVSAASTSNDAETESYDPRKRDPQYAHASASPLYELIPLLNHYHPAIALHARQLLSAQPVTATPDLSLNTLSHFLDRFVYKNPKKPKPKGASAMQPAASGLDGEGVKLVKGEAVGMEGTVNEEKFWKRRVEDVPVDEVFFHRYFTQKNERAKSMAEKVKKRKVKGEDDESDEEEDGDSEEEAGEDEEEDEGQSAGEEEASEAEGKESAEDDSDEEEAEIWKAMKATMPAELQDDDLSIDSDDLPSDLDDDDDESDEEADAPSSDEDDEEVEKDEENDEDALSLVEDSDNEDLVPLDADVPDGLIEFDGPASDNDDEEGEWGGIGGGSQKKRKRGEEDGDSKKQRRKKLRSLPTFASYEDYAKMIEDGPEDNI